MDGRVTEYRSREIVKNDCFVWNRGFTELEGDGLLLTLDG